MARASLASAPRTAAALTQQQASSATHSYSRTRRRPLAKWWLSLPSPRVSARVPELRAACEQLAPNIASSSSLVRCRGDQAKVQVLAGMATPARPTEAATPVIAPAASRCSIMMFAHGSPWLAHRAWTRPCVFVAVRGDDLSRQEVARGWSRGEVHVLVGVQDLVVGGPRTCAIAQHRLRWRRFTAALSPARERALRRRRRQCDRASARRLGRRARARQQRGRRATETRAVARRSPPRPGFPRHDDN